LNLKKKNKTSVNQSGRSFPSVFLRIKNLHTFSKRKRIKNLTILNEKKEKNVVKLLSSLERKEKIKIIVK